MQQVHVIPSGTEWVLEREDGQRLGQFTAQADAEAAAKTWARAHGDCDIVLHLHGSRSDDAEGLAG